MENKEGRSKWQPANRDEAEGAEEVANMNKTSQVLKGNGHSGESLNRTVPIQGTLEGSTISQN